MSVNHIVQNDRDDWWRLVTTDDDLCVHDFCWTFVAKYFHNCCTISYRCNAVFYNFVYLRWNLVFVMSERWKPSHKTSCCNFNSNLSSSEIFVFLPMWTMVSNLKFKPFKDVQSKGSTKNVIKKGMLDTCGHLHHCLLQCNERFCWLLCAYDNLSIISGKTSLADALVASNGIISNRLAGKVSFSERSTIVYK